MNETKVYFLVIEHIKTLVQQGELSFGGRLPSERQLMATLGLSRNSIREALRSLENMGIIESRHGQGNYLVNHIGDSLGSIFSLLIFLNECSVQEISDLRRSIETGAYLLAVKKASDAEIQALSLSLDRLKSSSAKDHALFDKQFHDTLISLSGNRLMKLLNDTLSQPFEHVIQQKLTQISPDQWNALLAEHTRIYECLTAREEAAGISAIMEHYDYISKIC